MFVPTCFIANSLLVTTCWYKNTNLYKKMELFYSLGMNHDGEANEGNYCDADKYLMSAILGPGKVAWSDCSKKELEDFLDGRSSKSVDQVCQLTQFLFSLFVKKLYVHKNVLF